MNKFKAIIASAFAAALVFATPVHAEGESHQIKVRRATDFGYVEAFEVGSVNGVLVEGAPGEQVAEGLYDGRIYSGKTGDTVALKLKQSEGYGDDDILIIDNTFYRPVKKEGNNVYFMFQMPDHDTTAWVGHEDYMKDDDIYQGGNLKQVKVNLGEPEFKAAGKTGKTEGKKDVPAAGDPTSIASLVALLSVSAAGVYTSKKALKK